MEQVNDLQMSIQPTPNPNAYKIILEKDVKAEGRSSYRGPDECQHVPLVLELFKIRGVDQVHLFQNVITLSKFSYADWDEIESQAINSLQINLPQHNPDYHDPNPEAERRNKLSPELKQIEEILDHTIRPGLQGDGGDLVCLSYEDHILIIKYQGACGTCPSSSAGTLQAIKSILKEQFDPEIDVYTAPEF